MKTNRFEENLRKKLEGIQPEFNESDWNRFKAYSHAGEGQSFWRTYGKWVYYAAASVSALAVVAGGLVLQQNRQTDLLRNEIKALKKTIETQQQKPVQITDTVYIIKTVPVDVPDRKITYRTVEVPAELPVTGEVLPAAQAPELTTANETLAQQETNETVTDRPENVSQPNTNPVSTPVTVATASVLTRTALPELEPTSYTERPVEESETGLELPSVRFKPFTSTRLSSAKGQKKRNRKSETGSGQTLAQESMAVRTGNLKAGAKENQSNRSGDTRTAASLRNSAQVPPASSAAGKLRDLPKADPGSSRETLANRQTATATEVSPSGKTTETGIAANQNAANAATAPTEAKKAEKTIPDFLTRVPYRVGVAYQLQSKRQGTTVLFESLIGEKFSIHFGYTWGKMDELQFRDDREFYKATGWNFHRIYPNGFFKENPKYPNMMQPSANDIRITATFAQVPVGVNFRHEIGKELTLLAGAATAISVSGQRNVNYCLNYPSRALDFLVTEKLKRPTLENVSLSVGIEKRWDPLVVQLEPYAAIPSRSMAFYSEKASLGIRAKVMLQFGAKR